MPEIHNEANQSIAFESIRISLASPDKIREWSRGAVTKAETINYRTLKPEPDGLFCEKIFGPNKDWECHCGKYKKIRYKNMVCENCGVEVTKSSVRRERMGHIELAAPVSHIWYFKGIPSRMGLILEVSPKSLERVLYFAAYIVLKQGTSKYQKKEVITEIQYREEMANPEVTGFEARMGAEAILTLLEEIDLDKDSESLREELAHASGQKRTKIIKRLEVVEAFRTSGNRPEWMILQAIPVIPPDLRPMVELEGGRFATSDLNDLYRRIINRNNRLARLKELGAPDIIVRNEKRMLQEAVDALIDNGRHGRTVTGPGNRALKSLSDMLKGKQGRFRQNLLGKRVDYSGRSVIAVGPELKLYQCGLPKEMAIELFKPFVMKKLVENHAAHNIKNAKKMVERLETQVWDVLEDVIKEHPVMLNRAPTLHRLGIQAFEPILVEGKAIKLHPLVCPAFNADFDGDQMAVHLPLSVEAQAECRFMLLSPNNLLKPSDGGPVAVPSQDMVLGIYYLTQERPGAKGEGMCFRNMNEAILAYENGYITYHSRVKIRVSKKMEDGTVFTDTLDTTLGRCLFNEIIPQDLGFVDRTDPANALKLEIDFHVGKKHLKQILEKVINKHGATMTAEVLDSIKSMGYKYSTKAAMTVSISDMTVPANKAQLLQKAQETVDSITKDFRKGWITDNERYNSVIKTWEATDNELTEALLSGLDKYNNIYMMADSGARGSNKQIKQLAGMRGLMANTTGKTIELPIKSNFREGLDVLEYFISAHGARKGLSDTALRTADSGYLTRRLVDVSQELIIREDDCCEGKEIPYMEIKAFMNGKETVEELKERMTGRFLAETIYDPDTGEEIIRENTMVTPGMAGKIYDALVRRTRMNETAFEADEDEAARELRLTKKVSVKIRTVLSCRSHFGICAKCYGSNMATGQPVQVGEAVGIIAAQSIGEPGTQLTMRTFHTGGVAGGDITQGLPRVEELFEARKPKGVAIVSEIGGVVSIRDTNKKKRDIIVTAPDGSDSKTYQIPYDARIKTNDGKTIDGTVIEAGDPLTEGSISPHDILRIKGVRAVQDYMLKEVQSVYRLQGVEINDKHIETIVRQMLKKIRIEKSGDSPWLPGITVDVLEFDDMNESLLKEGKEPAEGTQIMLGITKASLATNSFLSAASFQETTKALTDAAINGKVDPLMGMKENVIIGKLIPAGTGLKRYRQLELDTDTQVREADVTGYEEEEPISDVEAFGYEESAEEEGDDALVYSDEETGEFADEEFSDAGEESMEDEFADTQPSAGAEDDDDLVITGEEEDR